MSTPSPSRKYYIVNRRPPGLDGERDPDIDLPAWSARYLSDDIALVRDPNGLYSFPVLGVDVSPADALSALPVELPMTMSQAEADALCDSLGLLRVDLVALTNDRAGG